MEILTAIFLLSLVGIGFLFITTPLICRQYESYRVYLVGFGIYAGAFALLCY